MISNRIVLSEEFPQVLLWLRKHVGYITVSLRSLTSSNSPKHFLS